MKTSYSPEQKAQALALYAEFGPAQASRQTGIAKGTIASWANRNHVQTIAPQTTQAATEAAQSRLGGLFWKIAVDRAEWIAAQPAEKDAVKPTTVAAIATDKALLLSGKATHRVEAVGSEHRETLNKILELRQAS